MGHHKVDAGRPGFAMDLLSVDGGKTVTLIGEEGVSRILAVIRGGCGLSATKRSLS